MIKFKTQYRLILLQPWKNEAVFAAGLPTDAVEFWVGILNYKNSLNIAPYEDLAKYVLKHNNFQQRFRRVNLFSCHKCEVRFEKQIHQ